MSLKFNSKIDYEEERYNAQNFNKITKDMQLWEQIIKKIGRDRAYLLDVLVFMEKDNSINFDRTGYSKAFIKKFRKRLENNGIVKRIKLDEKYKRYVNPLIQNHGRSIRTNLIRQFSEENKSLYGYKFDSRSNCFKKIN